MINPKKKMYQNIKNNIFEGVYKPGESLIEREICEKNNLSRTPVREVLFQLANEGLLVYEPSKGFSVKSVTLKETAEIFQAREAIETMATMLAARKGGECFHKELQELKYKFHNHDLHHELRENMKLGRQLHDLIVENASNRYLRQSYYKLTDLANLTFIGTTLDIEKLAKEYHLSIIESLLDNDDEESQSLMREHLRLTCKKLMEAQFSHNSYTLNTKYGEEK